MHSYLLNFERARVQSESIAFIYEKQQTNCKLGDVQRGPVEHSGHDRPYIAWPWHKQRQHGNQLPYAQNSGRLHSQSG